MSDRIAALSRIAPARRGWHYVNNYLPPLYADLSDEEFELLLAWFEATQQANSIGECGVSAASLLQGFVAGNGMSRIVQAGHYYGYSTLLLGMMLRRMGVKHGLISFDIDQAATGFAQEWIERAKLTDHVRLVLADSSDPIAPDLARNYFGGDPQLLFIDSSHQYRHTLEELQIWSRCVDSNGLICLHDVSVIAEKFDSTHRGGVRRAFIEWLHANAAEGITINGPTPYLDPCGFGIIRISPRPTLPPAAPANEKDRRMIRDPDFALNDSWTGNGWILESGARSSGGSAPLHCYAPIKKDETYEVVVTAEIGSGSLHVDAGWSGDVGVERIATSGTTTVSVKAAGSNGLISLVPTPDFNGVVSRVQARVLF